jgi:hypothetical protein
MQNKYDFKSGSFYRESLDRIFFDRTPFARTLFDRYISTYTKWFLTEKIERDHLIETFFENGRLTERPFVQ